MFTLPKLPYPASALEPHMSEETLHLHHNKHHKAYVDKLNGLVEGTPLASMSLDDLICHSRNAEDPDTKKIFNNAAQAWNHQFFWRCLSPDGGGSPSGAAAGLITQQFGTDKGFRDAFLEAAGQHFGSGWIWLALNEAGSAEIMTTHDADLPLASGKTALLTCDLWEHAYYLDYQNRKPEFLQAFLDHLVNWTFVSENLEQATAVKRRPDAG